MTQSIKAHLITFESHVTIHFNHRLPRLITPQTQRHSLFASPTELVEYRPKARLRLASRLAKCNFGQSPIEIGNPVEAYLQMLERFVEVEGLIHLVQSNPYMLTLEVGKLFNPLDVGQRVVSILGSCLFKTRIQFSAALEAFRTPGDFVTPASTVSALSGLVG